MIGQLQIGGMRLTGAAMKKMISSLLLIIALGAMAATYFLGREQVTRAAEVSQKVKFIKAGIEAQGSLRASLEAPREPVPGYFLMLNKNYKQLDKFLGSDSLDPNLEKLANDKVKSDQHLRARLIVIRDNLKVLLSKEKQITALSTGFESFLNFSSAGGMLDLGRIRTDSPMRKTAELLNTIGRLGPSWLNGPPDSEAFSTLQTSFTQLAEQRGALDNLAAADKLSPRQAEIYKALKKMPLWAKSGEYLEAINQFNAARVKLLDLTKDRDSLTSLLSSMETELNNTDSDLLMNALRMLTIICIVGALIVNIVIGRSFGFGNFGDIGSSSEQISALKETQDILPYTQVAISQISQLSGKVLNAIKRFHTIINDENFAARRKAVESMVPTQVAETDLKRLQSEITALREQALQLTLSSAGSQSPISMPECAMRLNKIVENMDASLASLQQSIVDSFLKKRNIESHDLQNISRESEALIVALSQLDRQVTRMEGVLEEMDVALQGAIQKDYSKTSKDETGGSRADTY
ncbi:hypothetical protein [Polynucleobacter sp. MWH-Berg-3C6]|uniref:hypothetical protein n=1 Tax=Polynucleobacter sp. MWH-Berg-3C6 TaxID=1855882 RepID=UPI001C0C10A4|nr:hypothetical protein [Polynucleobacter sp. MWH-Berg-3C6]MBU3550693.1 hypothetical protein [Polynucleobacter sp. MWH-Berg-3C6]